MLLRVSSPPLRQPERRKDKRQPHAPFNDIMIFNTTYTSIRPCVRTVKSTRHAVSHVSHVSAMRTRIQFPDARAYAERTRAPVTHITTSYVRREREHECNNAKRARAPKVEATAKNVTPPSLAKTLVVAALSCSPQPAAEKSPRIARKNLRTRRTHATANAYSIISTRLTR